MAKVSPRTASDVERMPGFEGRYATFHGWTVGFERYDEDSDAAPLFAGLPDDRCQCMHLGYVLRGRVTLRYPDREEHYEAGDAYVAPPGHTPVFHAGAEVVEFSPAEQLARTVEVVLGNLRAAGAA